VALREKRWCGEGPTAPGRIDSVVLSPGSALRRCCQTRFAKQKPLTGEKWHKRLRHKLRLRLSRRMRSWQGHGDNLLVGNMPQPDKTTDTRQKLSLLYESLIYTRSFQ